jgi:hypothetical protein
MKHLNKRLKEKINKNDQKLSDNPELKVELGKKNKAMNTLIKGMKLVSNEALDTNGDVLEHTLIEREKSR